MEILIATVLAAVLAACATVLVFDYLDQREQVLPPIAPLYENTQRLTTFLTCPTCDAEFQYAPKSSESFEKNLYVRAWCTCVKKHKRIEAREAMEVA